MHMHNNHIILWDPKSITTNKYALIGIVTWCTLLFLLSVYLLDILVISNFLFLHCFPERTFAYDHPITKYIACVSSCTCKLRKSSLCTKIQQISISQGITSKAASAKVNLMCFRNSVM